MGETRAAAAQIHSNEGRRVYAFRRCAFRSRSRSSPRPRARPGRSRASPGRGGGTTLPGKLLWKLDPGAIDRLARRLPQGSVARLGDERQDDDERDGRGDPPRPRVRVAHNSSGANLVSGVASTLLQRRRRRARPLRGRRGGAPRGRPPRPARRRSCSATSSATSSTATASSSSSPHAGATRSPRCRRRSSS